MTMNTDSPQEETKPTRPAVHPLRTIGLAMYAVAEHRMSVAESNAANWTNVYERLEKHADALEALETAVKGCGKEIGSVFRYNCGESLDDSKEPPHCPACNDAQWAAIRALLGYSTLSEIRGAQ